MSSMLNLFFTKPAALPRARMRNALPTKLEFHIVHVTTFIDSGWRTSTKWGLHQRQGKAVCGIKRKD
jgi:hypothetical protein